jgi:hypothetical protein
MKKIFELQPANGRKSFGGKCKVFEQDGKAQLLSYETIVAEINLEDNAYTQLWEGRSQTTDSHIKAFKQFYGV